MIPRRMIENASSFTDILTFHDRALTGSGKDAFYTYRVDSKGRITSNEIEANLYLAYLYFIQKDYKRANQLLKAKGSKLLSYNAAEEGLLKLIMSSFKESNDADPRAAAIRLRAHLILLDNQKKYGKTKNHENLCGMYSIIMKRI